MNLHPKTKQAYQLLHDGILAFSRAEQVGMRIDTEYCRRQSKRIEYQIQQLTSAFHSTKFWQHWINVYRSRPNMDSDYQLRHILYDVRKLEPPKLTKTGQGAVDVEALTLLSLPEIKPLVQKRKLKKVKDYLDNFLREQVNSVLHSFFNLHTAKTFRSSMSNVSFHNIPKRDEESMNIVRRAIFPRLGHLLFETDWSGAEIRMACIYTEDPKLIDDVLHGDMHKDMAIELYKLDGLDKSCLGEYNFRQGAKNGFVFPEFYGDFYGNCVKNLLDWARRSSLKDGTPGLVHLSDKGLIKLDANGNVRSDAKFSKHVEQVEDDFWNVRYKAYTKWKNRTWAKYQREGHIDMLSGFRCSGVMTRNEVLNAPNQGTAFHCLLKSFIMLDEIMRDEDWDSKLVGEIHDCLIVDTQLEELDHVAKTVQQVTCVDLPKEWTWISVPLEIDAEICGVNEPWNTKKGYEL